MACIIPLGKSLSIRPGRQQRAGYFASFKNATTSSGWVSAFFTVSQCLMTSPLGPITTVERIVPCTGLPYIIFFPKAPYFFMTSVFGSDKRANGSLYFCANLLCESMLSLLTPNTTAPDFFSTDPMSRKPQASLVHPGVSSFG